MSCVRHGGGALMSRLGTAIKTSFTDPGKRPRTIIWLGIIAIAFVVLAAVGVIGTSTNWFCMEPCHIVHYDNSSAYNLSTHSKISCVTCHEPLNGSPITFILMKIEVIPDLPPTIFKTFHMPMNGDSHVALEMEDEMCTQCHVLANRNITPSASILINHDIHTENDVTCVSCHNRVAHPEEDITFTLADNGPKENWMGMDACFRCHGLAEGSKAPGACATCHPADFKLRPASHDVANWYKDPATVGNAIHPAAWSEEESRVIEAEADEAEEIKHRAAPEMPAAGTINTCDTCHGETFCIDCHVIEMPHPADYNKAHAALATDNREACRQCHETAATAGADFCNTCHHPTWKAGSTWTQQHMNTAKETGADACFNCHDPRYCSACHIGGPERAAQFVKENEDR